MRLLTLGAASLMLLLNACGGPELSDGEKVPVPPASVFFEAQGDFTPASGQELATIGYFGDPAPEAPVHLYIVCHKGDTVYRDQMPAEWFAADSLWTAPQDSLAWLAVHTNMQKFLDREEFRARTVHDSLYAHMDAFRRQMLQ